MSTKPKNLFTNPVVLVALVTLLPLLQGAIDDYLTYGKVSPSQINHLLFSTAIAVTTAVVRYSEDEDEPFYTPRGLPGKSRKDFIDLDEDGIDDRNYIK